MIGEAMLPSVTCVCLTRNRRQFLPRAIECFQNQIYTDLRLLIAADRVEDVSGLVPGDPRISVVLIPTTTIGAKRNAACALVETDLIAHFDDDDISAPGRIADQVLRMLESGSQVDGFKTMKFATDDGRKWWKYMASPRYVMGTSLCYWKSWWAEHPFPERQIGEDSAFVGAAGDVLSCGEAAFDDVPACTSDLMVATVHAGNTGKHKGKGANWQLLGSAAV